MGSGLQRSWRNRVHSVAWARTIYSLLDMTKDRGLALVDLQHRQVFDPRGHIDIEVSIANGTKLPYLTEAIIRDVMADQDYYGDYIVVERSDHTYVQCLYGRGEECQVEYRAGRPDQHFPNTDVKSSPGGTPGLGLGAVWPDCLSSPGPALATLEI